MWFSFKLASFLNPVDLNLKQVIFFFQPLAKVKQVCNYQKSLIYLHWCLHRLWGPHPSDHLWIKERRSKVSIAMIDHRHHILTHFHKPFRTIRRICTMNIFFFCFMMAIKITLRSSKIPWANLLWTFSQQNTFGGTD